MDPLTHPVYNMPFTSKDAAKAAVAQEAENLQYLKTSLLEKYDEVITSNTSNPLIISKYETANTVVSGGRRQAIKEILLAVADDLDAIGYWLSPTTTAPALTGGCTLWTAGLTGKMNLANAIDQQCAELVPVINQLIDMVDILVTTSSTDPRVIGVFSALSNEEQSDFKARAREALAVYADNIRYLGNIWV